MGCVCVTVCAGFLPKVQVEIATTERTYTPTARPTPSAGPLGGSTGPEGTNRALLFSVLHPGPAQPRY
jgi:hypothetical protein